MENPFNKTSKMVQSISEKWEEPKNNKLKKISDKFDNNKQEVKLESLLENYFIKGAHHEMSVHLPENPHSQDGNYDEYKRINNLSEYQSTADSETDPSKYDFISDDINLGWKLHLNVTPENSVAVSQYLKKEGFVHKYLSGGDLEDGKIFTLYIGSHSLTKKLSQNLTKDLSELLAKPLEKNEIELTPGVVGRFRGDRKDFNQYGVYGISLRKDDNGVMLSDYYKFQKLEGAEKTKKYQELVYPRALAALKDLKSKYGDYFYKN